MKKKHKIMIVIASISALIITGVVFFQLTKDIEEYEFYYQDYSNTREQENIVKYNTKGREKEVIVQEKKDEYLINNYSNIYDIYNKNTMLIGGDLNGYTKAEYTKENLLNLDEIFDAYKKPAYLKYIKSNQDIACAKDNQILVYHRDTQEVEKVLELEDDPDFYIQNFDISYDGNTVYYVYNDTLFVYDIKEKTTNSIINNVSYFDVSTDETRIVYFNINDETLYLMNVNTGEVVKIDKETWRRKFYPPIFNEEGTAILYVKYAMEPTYVWYYIYNIDTQKSRKVLKVTEGYPTYGWY